MKFFIKKLITLIITLLVISFLTFTAFSVIPAGKGRDGRAVRAGAG